jgi:hypothetical protein
MHIAVAPQIGTAALDHGHSVVVPYKTSVDAMLWEHAFLENLGNELPGINLTNGLE